MSGLQENTSRLWCGICLLYTSTLISVIVIGVGAVFITKDIIAITDLITFLLFINNFTDPIRKLINFTEQFQNGASGYSRFLEIMSVCPDITDRPGAVDMQNVQGNIDFQNAVSYTHLHTYPHCRS